jgi:hypothetical protein
MIRMLRSEGCQVDVGRRGFDSTYSVWEESHESARDQGACLGFAGLRTLFHRACFDCHSNETAWPWYSHVAPVSWLVQSDVDDGRRHLNFSEWDRPQRHAKDVDEQVKQRDMPPWFYLPMHPAAKLTEAEKQALIDAAGKSLGPQGVGAMR